jgi:hypothetical protein
MATHHIVVNPYNPLTSTNMHHTRATQIVAVDVVIYKDIQHRSSTQASISSKNNNNMLIQTASHAVGEVGKAPPRFTFHPTSEAHLRILFRPNSEANCIIQDLNLEATSPKASTSTV